MPGLFFRIIERKFQDNRIKQTNKKANITTKIVGIRLEINSK
jgi:hypothetical protein